MSEYKLEIKQIVDYPRCRMYREFVRKLTKVKNIRVGNSCGLYYYIVLCCFANFRSSYKRVKGFFFNIFPGEWVISITELTKYLRTGSKLKILAVMQTLQDRHLLTFEIVGRGNLIKYRITNWAKNNRILEYNAPCQKDIGFFFVPMNIATELVSCGKCSEMDALLDLWMNTVYNDPQVQGSDISPVVYIRNGTGNPLVSYAELAERWGISKATVGRYIKHLSELGCISCVSFSGKHGTVISLCGYLSTMFSVSDVMLDKQEIALALAIKVKSEDVDSSDSDENSCVSESAVCVSKNDAGKVIKKVLFFLAGQGISCAECGRAACMLFRLSDCKRSIKYLTLGERYILGLSCGEKETLYRVELCLKPCDAEFPKRPC